MKEHGQFTCYLVGSGSLAIRCAELLQSKFLIKGILSSDLAVKHWSKINQILSLKSYLELQQLLETERCDYLFSIVNHQILSPEIINLVGTAINYHDALLPRYAGVHATAWAIANGEVNHGITWHQITPEIDTGNILKQVSLAVDPLDTTLTLNAKCYEAAIASFEELITELTTDTVVAIPQDLSQRSYVARHQKPLHWGILDWQQSAEALDCLVRGLNFGNYDNPLASAKLLLDSVHGLDYLIVNQAITLATKSPASPGTIVGITPEQLIITTATCDLALIELTTKQGHTISGRDLISVYQLELGQQLPLLAVEDSSAIAKLAATHSPRESYWCQQLHQWQPLVLPRMQKSSVISTPEDFCRVELPISQQLSFAQQHYPQAIPEAILGMLAIYLSRIAGSQSITLGWELIGNTQAIAPWFANCVPFNLTIAPEDTFETVVKAVSRRLKLNRQSGTYATDLNARYPELVQQPTYNVTVGEGITQPSSHLTISIESERYYWIYNRNVLTAEQIAVMLEQWQTITSAMIAQPATEIAKLPLISPKEIQQLQTWNPQPSDYPEHLCLHQLFEARVSENPDAIAVVYQGQSLTRSQLNQKANQLAHCLQQLGVQPETLVGICLERSLDMAIALYAVLKAGCAYLPLDPNYPPARLSYILEDAGLDILLTQNHLQTRLPPTTATIICLDRDWSDFPASNPHNHTHSHNLAYIIYTSGSTGNPKGVAIEHHSAVNTLWDIQERFQVGSGDRVLAVSSLSFDLSVYDFFGSLGAGGTAILPVTATTPDPAHWLELIAREQVTIWNSAPALLELLVQYLIAYELQLPPCLRLVMLSGDRINPNLIVELQNLQPQLEIVSLGGATEASIWSIYYPITVPWSPERIVPYGRPLQNQSFYILDRQQQLAPIGAIGELYIGGIGVARGYLNRPELNQAKFITNPVDGSSDRRLYRTGDLGRYLEDGNIEFLGRIDNQVKIKGVRIELGEIEAAILQCPDIQETVVTVASTDQEQTSLIAYAILKPNSVLTTRQLKDLLALQLPQYSIPTRIVFLDAFPLTPNGKVDLKALHLTPSNPVTEHTAPYLPVQDPLEFQLSEIWLQVLKVASITRDDDFFSLGGNSLLALRLFERIAKKIGIDLPLATLFNAPTIAQLATIIRDRHPATTNRIVVQMKTSGSQLPLFCIHAIGGNVLSYQPLVRSLDCDRPIYGIQAPNLIAEASFSSLEAMAVNYLQAIRAIQPQGPYYLSGHSFGGHVAYEIARKLEQQRESVAMLALFDCLGPNYTHKFSLSQKLQIHAHNLVQLSGVDAWQYLRDRLEYNLRAKVPRYLQQKYFEYLERLLPLQQRLVSQTTRQHYQLLDNYLPQPYKGRITLFRAQIRDPYAYNDPAGGWQNLALGGVDTCYIPGNHITMLNQPELACYLEKAMAQLPNNSTNSKISCVSEDLM